MSDPAAFVLARLDEWEQAARTLDQMPRWVMEHDLPNALPGVAQHIAHHDPARVLAQVAALRAVVELHRPDRGADTWYWLERECAECHHRWHKWVPDRPPTEIGPEQGCPTMRLLAGIWADHPDFDPAWKVET